MKSVMYKAVTLDENEEKPQAEEMYHRLITENKVNIKCIIHSLQFCEQIRLCYGMQV